MAKLGDWRNRRHRFASSILTTLESLTLKVPARRLLQHEETRLPPSMHLSSSSHSSSFLSQCELPSRSTLSRIHRTAFAPRKPSVRREHYPSSAPTLLLKSSPTYSRNRLLQVPLRDWFPRRHLSTSTRNPYPRIPEQPSLSILETLISPPNQHPTLRNLQLDCVDRVGTIGTRLSTIAIHFSSIKPGTKVAIDDFFPEDWDVPQVPTEYSIEELEVLQLAGTKNGVQVVGNVFEALEVREAYEEDVELLKKRWENWKIQGRRARGIKGKQIRR
ncbi:hypothetical protein JCM5350_003993 [Sporobolomyces pararoseus]